MSITGEPGGLPVLFGSGGQLGRAPTPPSASGPRCSTNVSAERVSSQMIDVSMLDCQIAILPENAFAR